MPTKLLFLILLESPQTEHKLIVIMHRNVNPHQRRVTLVLLGQPPPSLRVVHPNSIKRHMLATSGNLLSKEGNQKPGRHVGALTFGGYVRHGSSTAGTGVARRTF